MLSFLTNKDLLPLVTLVLGAVLGWVLNQLSQWLLVRRDEKKALARAVADLLEIRHRLLALPKVTEFLSQHFGLPQEGHTLIKVVMSQLMPPDADLSKRYAESVTLVSATNPILGFRLRSQDHVSPVLEQLRKIALSDPRAMVAQAKVEKEILEQLLPNFEKLISELAWSHSILTWWRARQQMKRSFVLPVDFVAGLKTLVPQPTQPASTESADPP